MEPLREMRKIFGANPLHKIRNTRWVICFSTSKSRFHALSLSLSLSLCVFLLATGYQQKTKQKKKQKYRFSSHFSVCVSLCLFLAPPLPLLLFRSPCWWDYNHPTQKLTPPPSTSWGFVFRWASTIHKTKQTSQAFFFFHYLLCRPSIKQKTIHPLPLKPNNIHQPILRSSLPSDWLWCLLSDHLV